MITIKNVHKSFGTQTLLENAFLQINAGDRFALVGPNGAGKSTLFKMLLGETEPDSGEIQLKRGVMCGYLPQENPPLMETSILAETLAHHEDPDGKVTAKAKTVLMGLGFKISDFDRKVSTLSGGWAMRVAMARLLIQEPDLLMLDEPTNHLDLDSLLWFQNYLLGYRGAIFLISHDRAFINTVCKAIVSLENQDLKSYHGNYDFYLSEKASQRERLESAYRNQQKEISEMEEFINRNRARASTASRAQSMIKRLEKIERVELPEDLKTVHIRFPQPERTGVKVLELKNLYKSYGDLKVYEGLNFEIERGWKMAFVGHNGAGKSTLLKVLAGAIPFDSGERKLGLNVNVGYFSQHRAEHLDPHKTVLQEALSTPRSHSEQFIRTVLGSFLFQGQTVFKKTSVLSGGEKSRLSLVKILLDPPNVLLMDEPTTHLDIPSVDALIEALKGFEGTLCVISHDLYFLNALVDHVVHVDQGKITVYPGNYDYFKRRQTQLESEKISTHSESENNDIVSEFQKSYPSVNSKEERRKKAQEREKDREKQNQFNSIKNQIAEYELKIASLTAKMQDPKIYSNYSEVHNITSEITQFQNQIKLLNEQLILFQV